MEILVYAVVRGHQITMVSDRKQEIQVYVETYNRLKRAEGPLAELRSAILKL
ncbi:MAG: hypothetical protein JWM11_3920 [Planctomycetaceae bacterium]|nr:hypothetical protein [Planctomycetaceae bacterium]